MNTSESDVHEQDELVITRILDAPRELVWKAWTDPQQLARWWGPDGFSNPVCELDLRPGGTILIHMRAPDGMVYPLSGHYLEILAPERLVFVSTPLDANNQPIFETLTTIIFSEQGNSTKLMVRTRVTTMTPAAAPYLAGMNEGWKQSLERLASLLAMRHGGG